MEIFIKILDIILAVILSLISYAIYKERYNPKKDTVALIVLILGLTIFLR